MSKRIPVCSGPLIIDHCDPSSVLQRYGGRVNVQIVRARKTGEVVRVVLAEHGDDYKRKAHSSGRALTYEETLNNGSSHLVVLKRFDSTEGRFVRWTDNQGFNPLRFNPDCIRPLLPQHRDSARSF